MQSVTCEHCGQRTPPCDTVHCGSADGNYRQWCIACVNHDAAQRMGIHRFEHTSFAPVCIRDARGVEHTFHFRVRLTGGLAIDAFELIDGSPGGYQFLIMQDPDTDPWVLLGRLIERIRRALSLTHLSEDRFGPGISERRVRGRIEAEMDGHSCLPVPVIDGREISWDAFGRMLTEFAGWQIQTRMLRSLGGGLMPLQAIAGELAKIGDKAGFVSVRSAVANDLALDVAGVGRLRLPRAARCRRR
jgi:hypothetical protein